MKTSVTREEKRTVEYKENQIERAKSELLALGKVEDTNKQANDLKQFIYKLDIEVKEQKKQEALVAHKKKK